MTWLEFLANADKYVVIPLLAAVGLAVAGWVVRVGNALVTELERKTGVQIAQQQHDAVKEAAVTGAGQLRTLLDQGAMRLADIRQNDPTVIALAEQAIARVPNAAAAMDKTVPSMAQSIIGLVDTSPGQPIAPTTTGIPS